VDAEIERVIKDGVSDADLGRLKTRMLGDWYRQLDPLIARADTLAKLQAVWGDAKVVNDIPRWMEGVTSADLQRVAKTYLTRSNRTVIDRVPAALTKAHGAPEPKE
jgi:predicted Zn-dependent peptidase